MLQIVTIRARDGERKGGYWITEEILFGKYQIIGELGSGSRMCVVGKALRIEWFEGDQEGSESQ